MKNKLYLITTLLLSAFIPACKKADVINQQTSLTKSSVSNVLTFAAVAPVVSYTDESVFVSSLSSYGFKNPTQLSLNRTATAAGYNSVYGFNIPAANQVKGFKWNAGDEQTGDWRPQGICGFTWGSKTYLLVTWYGTDTDEVADSHNHYKGSRLALVDITNMNAITYRLILLVQSKANYSTSLLYDKPVAPESPVQYDSFIPVTMHAGGVAYYNQKIYVADTSLGLRVFDLNNLIDAVDGDTDKNSIGKQSNGHLIAFDYTCILPQTGYYKITGGASPFSSVSLGSGASASAKYLWTSQYKKADATTVPQMFGFPINSSGVVSGPALISTPYDNTGAGDYVHYAQGAYKAGTTAFLTITGQSLYEGSTGRLVKYIDGATMGSRYRWPHGAEALYVDSSNLMWCLTEYETAKYGQDNRTVFCVRVSDYQ
jgi:hypothetical protein